MPEPINDRLEQFFRKAASRADVSFNEDDWKKLEARLDDAGVGKTSLTRRGTMIKMAILIGVLTIISTALWLNARYDTLSSTDPVSPTRGVSPVTPDAGAASTDVHKSPNGKTGGKIAGENIDNVRQQPDIHEHRGIQPGLAILEDQRVSSPFAIGAERTVKADAPPGGQHTEAAGQAQQIPLGELPRPLPADKIDRELIRGFPVSAETYKQKAVVELPGAEEEKTHEVDANVDRKLASDQTKILAMPRLSLLLSLAPDFSGTSLSRYSSPGRAFGAMTHYHLLRRWSISVGVIKNQKQYTGDGEDYKPPQNYWKYYTNGIIPETIDGSCTILEFPLMIQYTLHNQGNNKWLIGGGTSTYLMQTESYVYNFSQPNPGAKERWDSRKSSQFFFNMINFTIAYERQVLPGLMLGIEPYAKIPVEAIGWSNLRLFSTGASVTLRYIVLRKGKLSLLQENRGPD